MTKTQKPQTPFLEESGGPARGWLNNPRWQLLPQGHHPPRDRVQREVSADERTKALSIIQQYRAQEELARQHDADPLQVELHRLGDNGQHGHRRAELRKALESCDRETFMVAQTKLRELRGDAEKVVIAILHRLVASFDVELQENALQEEARLQAQGFPILDEHRGAWVLHGFPIINALHARRESCRHLIQQFEIKGRGEELAIVTLQYLGTSDDVSANFSFLP
jgi:plasmid stabilization system protein ParE